MDIRTEPTRSPSYDVFFVTRTPAVLHILADESIILALEDVGIGSTDAEIK